MEFFQPHSPQNLVGDTIMFHRFSKVRSRKTLLLWLYLALVQLCSLWCRRQSWGSGMEDALLELSFDVLIAI